MLLADLGLDPASDAARETVALVGRNCRWEYDDLPFFAGEVEPCINGRTVAVGAHLGADVGGIVRRLLDDQLPDGGWNCWTESGATVSSFDSTINVVEGLLAWERATGSPAEVAVARRRGEEYLLARGLLRRRSDGAVIDDGWRVIHVPAYWCYDVLRGLDHLRASGREPDPRSGEAVEVIRAARRPDGTWAAEPHAGRPLIDLGPVANGIATTRARRVLAWAGVAA